MKRQLKIKGLHPIRDAKICRFWTEELLTFQEIAEKVGLTQRRVRQILKHNRAWIPVDKQWEKDKRVQALKVEIKNSDKSKKDRADLIEQLRKEIEGDKPIVQINTYTQIWNEKAKKAEEVNENGRITTLQNP